MMTYSSHLHWWQTKPVAHQVCALVTSSKSGMMLLLSPLKV